MIALSEGRNGAASSQRALLLFRIDLNLHRSQDAQILGGQLERFIALLIIILIALRPQPNFQLECQFHFESGFAQPLDRGGDCRRVAHGFINCGADFFCQPFCIFVHFHEVMLSQAR